MVSTRNRRVQSNRRNQSNPNGASKTAENNHFLLYIEETASYFIVAKHKVIEINEQGFAIVSMKRKMISTKIILNGSFEQCENEVERLNRHSCDLTEGTDSPVQKNQEESETITTHVRSSVTTKESQSVLNPTDVHQQSFLGETDATKDKQKSLDGEESDDNDGGNDENEEDQEEEGDEEERSGLENNNNSYLHDHLSPVAQRLTNKRKYSSNDRARQSKRTKKGYSQSFAQEPSGISNVPNLSNFLNLEHKMVDLQKKLSIIEEKSDQAVIKMTKKIDHLVSAATLNKTMLNSYRGESGEEFPNEIVYHGINLLSIQCSSFGDFARKALKTVFTEDELQSHILPPERLYLSRPALDQDRFDLLNEAIRVKFKIDSSKYSVFYKNLLRRKMCDFLTEERRRASLKLARRQWRSQK